MKKKTAEKDTSLIDSLDLLVKEKHIHKDVILDAIETSLIKACKENYGNSDNVHVSLNRSTGEFRVYADRLIVEEVMDPVTEITLADAREINPTLALGDYCQVPINSKNFSRIATVNAKSVITQKIREEERKSIYEEYHALEKEVISGTVQRYIGDTVSIDIGHTDGLLLKGEQVKGETYHSTDRIKVYVLEVKDSPKGPRIMVSRSHPDLVKRLFENEVTEIRDGIVEIKSITREAGSRTKMAVWSNDPQVDPVGACVGLNGVRVNAVVDEIHGEKIDIIRWDPNPALLIENALSPAKVIGVWADEEDKSALVIVPDDVLSLAIGREGQNARLAAKLTGFKIDIKSETQAKESGLFEELGITDEEYEGYTEEDDIEQFDQDEDSDNE